MGTERIIGIKLVVDDEGTVKVVKFTEAAKQAFGQAEHATEGLNESMAEGARRSKKVEGAMAEVERRAGTLTSKVKNIGAGFKGVYTSGKNAFDRLYQAGQGAFNRLHQAGSVFWSTTKSITGAIFSLKGALVGLGLGLVAKSFLDVSRETENYHTRLTTLLGSQQKATEAMRYFQEVAAGVPFTLQAVVEAGTSLEAFGADSKKWLTPLTDLAAVMGIDLPEAAQALGRAYAGGAGAADIFRERGILQIIKDTAKLKAGIEDISKLSLPKFRELMLATFTDPDGRIAGAAQGLAKNWDGMISMLSDKWFQFRQRMMNAGVFDLLKNQLQRLLDALDTHRDTLNHWAESAGRAVEKLLQKGGSFVEDIINNWGKWEARWERFKRGASEYWEKTKSVASTISDLFSTALDSWNSLPPVIREFGLIGALLGGAKAKLVFGTMLALGALGNQLKSVADKVKQEGGAGAQVVGGLDLLNQTGGLSLQGILGALVNQLVVKPLAGQEAPPLSLQASGSSGIPNRGSSSRVEIRLPGATGGGGTGWGGNLGGAVDAEAIAKIEAKITEQVAKATLERYELRERELGRMVADYQKAGGDVSHIEDQVNKLRIANYSEYVDKALKEESKKSEALGKEALKLGRLDEQTWQRKEQGERALREKLRLLGLQGTELELERLRQEVEGYERAGYDKELIAAYAARRLQEINRSALDQVLADWADGAGNMQRVTANAFDNIRSMLADDLTRFFKGEFDGIGDLWQSLMDNMLNMFSQLVAQILVIWGTSNIARLFTGDPYLPLLDGVLNLKSTGGGPLQTAGTVASLYSAGKSVLSGLGLLGPTAAAADATTTGLMAAGPGIQAAAEAALAAEVSAALGTSTAAESALAVYGGTMAGGEFAGTYGAVSGLGAMAGPMALALGPGLVGMMFHDQISGLLGMQTGPMTPEEAVSNWEGQSQFIETLTANMEKMGQTVQEVGSQFGLFGETARDMAEDFDRLGTVAGYTEEQLEAVRAGLSPMAQEMLASGQAANTLGGEVEQLVSQINAAANSMALTSSETKIFDERIAQLAERMGLSGQEAQSFRDQIYQLAQSFSRGGEEGEAFGRALDQFVATTLQGVAEGAGAGREAVLGLLEAMNGAKGAAGSFTSALPQGGAVNDLGLYTGGSFDVGDLGIGSFHSGGLVRHAGGGIVPWGWVSYQELMKLAGDEVLTKLQLGEYVIQADSVNPLTKPWLDMVNDTGRPPVLALPEPVLTPAPTSESPTVQVTNVYNLEGMTIPVTVSGPVEHPRQTGEQIGEGIWEGIKTRLRRGEQLEGSGGKVAI